MFVVTDVFKIKDNLLELINVDLVARASKILPKF